MSRRNLCLGFFFGLILFAALSLSPGDSAQAQRATRTRGDGPKPYGSEGPHPFRVEIRGGGPIPTRVGACGGDGPQPLRIEIRGSEGPQPLLVTFGGDGPSPFLIHLNCGAPHLGPVLLTPTGLVGGKKWSQPFKPQDLPPEAGPPIKELVSTEKPFGRIIAQGDNIHKVFVRVMDNHGGKHRKCTLTLLDKPVIPIQITPYLDLYGNSSPLPTNWIELPLQSKRKYYLFDGLQLSATLGGWILVDKTHVIKWQTGNGYYYRFGYVDPFGPSHSVTPPGDLVIEAVVVQYYSREQKGEPEKKAYKVDEPAKTPKKS